MHLLCPPCLSPNLQPTHISCLYCRSRLILLKPKADLDPLLLFLQQLSIDFWIKPEVISMAWKISMTWFSLASQFCFQSSLSKFLRSTSIFRYVSFWSFKAAHCLLLCKDHTQSPVPSMLFSYPSSLRTPVSL